MNNETNKQTIRDYCKILMLSFPINADSAIFNKYLSEHEESMARLCERNRLSGWLKGFFWGAVAAIFIFITFVL